MSITDAGTVSTTLYDRYVGELGCVNTTFIVPRDTNTFARLVERVVEPGDVVLDLGCGDGIATIHAAACGAAAVVGIDVNADAVSNARSNAQRVEASESWARLKAGLYNGSANAGRSDDSCNGRGGSSLDFARDRLDPPGIVAIEQMDMRAVLTDAAARADLLERCGLGGRDIDVVISNPPYVPMSSELAWQPRDLEAIRALPVKDLGMLGRSDALLERVTTLRTAMMTAERGGPDGLQFVREILAYAPRFAARLAWLQASYTSPMTVLELIERSRLSIETLVAYATPFGASAAYSRSTQHAYLSEMRENGDAYFWSAADGTPWVLLLGFSFRRDARPLNYDGPAVRASLHRFLMSFRERGPDAVSGWREDMPFEMEVGRYVA